MVRTSYKAFAVLALAAISIVGCGNEDVTDLNDTWMKAETDLSTKITEVQAEHTQMTSAFTAMPAAADMDTAKMQDRTMVDQMIQAHTTALGEVETKFNELKAKREESLKAGVRADFEAGWNAAKAEYDGLNAKLDELKSQHGDMKSKMDGLSSAPVVNDTAVSAKVAPATKDTAAAKADTAAAH